MYKYRNQLGGYLSSRTDGVCLGRLQAGASSVQYVKMGQELIRAGAPDLMQCGRLYPGRPQM
jgi:hypothetical protein